MATHEHQISSSGGETEDTDQTFRPAESDTDLRRKSFPPITFTLNAGQITDTLRCASANGANSNDPPLALSIHRATKAAFEDSPLLPVVKTGDNKKSDDESVRLLATLNITDHVTKVIQDATEMMSSTNEKKGAASEYIENIVTHSNDDRSLVDAQEDAVSGGQPALFERRTPSNETPHRVFRDKQNSLSSSEGASNIISCQGTEDFKNTEHRNQQLLIDSKPNSMEGDRIETSRDENNNATRKEAKLSSDEHTDREIIDRPCQEDADKTDTPKRSDTVESLVTFPKVQSETHKRRRTSTTPLPQFSSPGEAGGSRFRRVSPGSASNFPTLSTSGQSETPLSPRSSGAAEVRRGSRARRSSIAASMLGNSYVTQSRRDSVQADGSIGFSTLAASLVKWKINSLRAARKTKETIAKDAKHQEFLDRTADRIKTELPRSLLVSIQEEAYPIVLRTAQAYRSQLGTKHKLTLQACDRLTDLIRNLKDPY